MLPAALCEWALHAALMDRALHAAFCEWALHATLWDKALPAALTNRLLHAALWGRALSAALMDRALPAAGDCGDCALGLPLCYRTLFAAPGAGCYMPPLWTWRYLPPSRTG